MIGSLRGRLLLRDATELVVEVGGVGYRLTVTPDVAARAGEVGQEVFLHVHHHQREDAQVLYGFADVDGRRCFEALLSAHGVGPGLALSILGVLDPAELSRVVADEDLAALCQVPGVGRKTAARLVLELSNRLAAPTAVTGGGGATASAGGTAEAREALAALGYAPDEIRAALDGLPTDGATTELVRAALQRLAVA